MSEQGVTHGDEVRPDPFNRLCRDCLSRTATSSTLTVEAMELKTVRGLLFLSLFTRWMDLYIVNGDGTPDF